MPDEYTQDHSPLHATDQIPSRDTGPRERRLKRIFDTDGLTFGTGFPLTGINESRPPIDEEMGAAAHAESVGFDALWARDVPALLAAVRRRGPDLRYVAVAEPRGGSHRRDSAGHGQRRPPAAPPLHVAKSAASVDRLSDGRLVMGVATGDRDPEFPAFDVDPEARGKLFRESVDVMRTVWREDFPRSSRRGARSTAR